MHNSFEMKLANRTAVLNTIKSESSVSRASLARTLNMSPTSMTRICGDLAELGLIRETDLIKESAGAGRKASQLERNPDAFYSMGLLIRRDFISCVIINYQEEILFERKWEEPVATDSTAAAHQIHSYIEVLRDEIPDIFRHIEGIGISFPGLISPDGDRILSSDLFRWKDVAWKEALEMATNLPCYLYRDVKASVLEEGFHEADSSADIIGFLSLSQEVGAAFLQNRRVLTGQNGLLGEIAHKTLIPNGRLCSCGRKGCVNAYLSEQSILAQTAEAGHPCRHLSLLADAYHADEPWAVTLVETLADHLSLVIEDICLLQNPAKLILGGRTVKALPELTTLVRKNLEHSYYASILKDARIYNAVHLGKESTLGAAYIAMEETEILKIQSLK